MKKMYHIYIESCHEDTDCEVLMKESEAAFCAKLFDKINENSDCMCKPKIFIWEVNNNAK